MELQKYLVQSLYREFQLNSTKSNQFGIEFIDSETMRSYWSKYPNRFQRLIRLGVWGIQRLDHLESDNFSVVLGFKPSRIHLGSPTSKLGSL